GGNGFEDCLVPEAAIGLRQGFGRLIREERDEGLFVLGDARVLSMPYGERILSSLPEIEWLTDPASVISYLGDLV
ncbi:MAG: hypothetical protein KDI19_11605, partial [Pseudomonadales bacterium]|nr:hypothetical protein [Pseudomonadales bacterium]